MTNYSVVTLNQCLEKLESGGRPKGGASLDKNGILSIGAEHLGDDGEIKLENPKFIPLTYFENMRQGIVQDEDILIVKDGATTGKVVYISSNSLPNKTAVNEHVFLLRTNKKLLLPKFAFYLMYSPTGKQKILADFRGAAQGGISRSFVNNFTFPLPPLSEQRRIVEILDQADEIRKLRKQADEKAEKIIPALFYKMFGDPIELMKGDNSIALSEFNIEFQNGFACGEKDIVDGTPHLRMNNIDDLGILNLDLVRTVPNSFDKERYRLNNGDVLFMSTNSDDKIGKSFVFNIEEDRHFLFSNHLIRLRIFDDRISPEYLSTYLHLLWAKRFYPSIAKRWVNQSTISLQNLKNIKVFVPFKEKLNKLTDAIKNLNDNRKFRNNSLSVINSLFNNLLSKAFDGSLTASWREAHMKELLKEMEEQKKYLEQVK